MLLAHRILTIFSVTKPDKTNPLSLYCLGSRMSTNFIFLEGFTRQYQTCFDSYVSYGVEIIRSPQFSHSMSLIFIGMVLIMLIQTCDSKIGAPLPKAPEVVSSVKASNESFNTPPAKQVLL